MIRRPPRSTLFPYTRSSDLGVVLFEDEVVERRECSGGVEDALDGEHARADLGEAALVLARSEEHTSELQSRQHLVCRLLLEKKALIAVPHQIRPCPCATNTL